MWNPVTALLWQCWRMSRRWYLLILGVAIALHFALMNVPSPRNVPPGFPYREALATIGFMLNFTLAVFTTLFAITVGARTGFALRFEYRLPVSTTLLVAVPMLYLGAACASVFVIPILLSRLFFGIPIPFVPVAALLMTIVVALATSSWSTTGTSTRTVAVLIACIGLLDLFTKLHPLNFKTATKIGEPLFNPDIAALTPGDYGVLALLCLVLLAFTVHRVGLQRRGESWRLWPAAAGRQPVEATTSGQSAARNQVRGSLSDRASDLFRLPCPIGSPLQAEFWFELKRYGMPVLALALLLTLGLPLLLFAAKSSGWSGIESVIWMPVVGVFFIGIGIAFFNRRVGSGGYMNAFEGTRALSTLQLAVVQFLTVGASTLIGIVLITVSLWLSQPLLDTSALVMVRAHAVATTFAALSLPAQVCTIVMSATLYLALIALLTCLHSCSVFWGRKVLYGMIAFIIYCIGFSYAISSGNAALENIQHHMWGFAGLMLLLTLLVLGRVLYLKLLSLQAGSTALVGWLVFVACARFSLRSLDIDLASQASELQVFNAALLALPLMLFLLTAWCYDKLRHR